MRKCVCVGGTSTMGGGPLQVVLFANEPCKCGVAAAWEGGSLQAVLFAPMLSRRRTTQTTTTTQALGVVVFDSVGGLRATLEAHEDLREWVLQRCGRCCVLAMMWAGCVQSVQPRFPAPRVSAVGERAMPLRSAVGRRCIARCPRERVHTRPTRMCPPPITLSYIDRPLLVGGTKFHVRAYALCVGALTCYVFSEARVRVCVCRV